MVVCPGFGLVCCGLGKSPPKVVDCKLPVGNWVAVKGNWMWPGLVKSKKDEFEVGKLFQYIFDHPVLSKEKTHGELSITGDEEWVRGWFLQRLRFVREKATIWAIEEKRKVKVIKNKNFFATVGSGMDTVHQLYGVGELGQLLGAFWGFLELIELNSLLQFRDQRQQPPSEAFVQSCQKNSRKSQQKPTLLRIKALLLILELIGTKFFWKLAELIRFEASIFRVGGGGGFFLGKIGSNDCFPKTISFFPKFKEIEP